MNSALVVGQEVSLTVILLAVHREIVAFEDRNHTEKKPNQAQNALEYMAEKSFIAMEKAQREIASLFLDMNTKVQLDNVSRLSFLLIL